MAVILYDAGMSLDLRKLRGHTRRVVDRLIVMGVPVTFAFGAVFAGLLLGMSRQAALMTGAILVVSGPTVVGPLLTFIRPTERLQRVLSWEGSLINSVGGILGAVVFHAVVASTRLPVRAVPDRHRRGPGGRSSRPWYSCLSACCSSPSRPR